MSCPTHRPRKLFPIAAALLGGCAIAQAGVMRHDIARQNYADFASNLGKFSPGAMVAIYDTAGNETGRLLVPNFDSVPNGLSSILSGSSQSIIGIAHGNWYTPVYYSRYDVNYNNVNALTDTYYQIFVASVDRQSGSENEGNIRRLDKIITEATPTPVMTDVAQLMGLPDRVLVRAGDGTTSRAISGSQAIDILPAGFLGGTIRYARVGTDQGQDGTISYRFTTTFTEIEARNSPLGISMDGGDSGSPTLGWNTTTNQYELVGVHKSGSSSRTGRFGYDKSSNQTLAPTFYANQVESWNSPAVTPIGVRLSGEG